MGSPLTPPFLCFLQPADGGVHQLQRPLVHRRSYLRLLHRTSIQRYMDHRPSFENISQEHIRESLIAISYCMPERFSCLTVVAVATETRVETAVDIMRSKLISIAASR